MDQVKPFNQDDFNNKYCTKSNESKKKKEKTEIQKIYLELIAGGIAGTSAQIVCYPIDTIKTIFQDSTRLSYFSITKSIFQQGVSQFWKGFFVPSLNFGIVNSVCFCSYYYTKKAYDPENKSDKVTILAATFSGFCQLVPWVPTEVIKIQMQQRAHLPESQNATVKSTIKYIYHTEGLRGFYHGGLAQASRDIPNNIIYFLTYSKCSDFLQKHANLHPICQNLISGFVTGFFAWVFVIPMDLVKTRVQTGADKNIRTFLKKVFLWRELSIFHGSLLSTARSCSVNAIIFLVYEQLFPVLDDLM